MSLIRPKGTAALRKKASMNLEASVSMSIWRAATSRGERPQRSLSGSLSRKWMTSGGVEAGLALADAVDVGVDEATVAGDDGDAVGPELPEAPHGSVGRQRVEAAVRVQRDDGVVLLEEEGVAKDLEIGEEAFPELEGGLLGVGMLEEALEGVVEEGSAVPVLEPEADLRGGGGDLPDAGVDDLVLPVALAGEFGEVDRGVLLDAHLPRGDEREGAFEAEVVEGLRGEREAARLEERHGHPEGSVPQNSVSAWSLVGVSP